MRALAVVTLVAACATAPDEELAGSEDAIESAGAYYHVDAAAGLGPATLTVVNGYKVKCPNGAFATTCTVDALQVPADCGFECQDGLFGLQGETVVRGRFAGHQFVIEEGYDTWAHGLGGYSVYRVSGAPTCTADPCPTGLVAQKLDTKAAATHVASLDVAHASDPNFVLDPTRADAAIAEGGLLVSGHIVSHVFRADRVWRRETPRPACAPQEVARAYADPHDGREVRQVRTVAEAERLVDPNGESTVWLVRTAETPAAATFTLGYNDLWAQRFAIAKTDCSLTVTGEH